MPANLVKKMHGPALHQEALQTSIKEAMDKLVSDKALRPAMQPDVSLGEGYEQGKDAELSVSLEVLPQIEAPSLDGLKLEKLTVPVTDEQVDESVERIAGQQKSYEAEEGRAAEDGDQVVCDFVGKLDGEEFEGGKAEQQAIVIGSGHLIPGFEEQLIGAKAGEERTITVTFPEDYGAEHLAGHDFAVPPTMVEAEFEQIWQQLQQEAGSEEDPEAARAEIESEKDDYRKIAERRVRLGLLLSEIGQSNGVEVSAQEMQMLLQQAAQQYRPEDRQRFADYVRSDPMAAAQLRAPLYEDKVVDFLIEKAEVTEREVTREELQAAIEADADGAAAQTEEKPAKKAPKKSAKKAESGEGADAQTENDGAAEAQPKKAPAKKAKAASETPAEGEAESAAEAKPAKKAPAKKAAAEGGEAEGAEAKPAKKAPAKKATKTDD